MNEVSHQTVFKRYEIQIDFGTSSCKCSIRTGKNTFVNYEFLSMFLRSPESFVGLNEFTVTAPVEYAGLCDFPVQDHNPSPISRDPHFFISEEFKLGVFYAVAKGLDLAHAPEMCEIRLVIAYPANYVNEVKALREELTSTTWPLDSGHSEREIIFSEVEAVAQGACVVYDAGLRWSDDGTTLTDRGFRRLLPLGKILVGCFGSNSVEWSLFSGRVDKMKSYSVFFGLIEMVKDLQKELRESTGLDFSQAEAMKVMREKTYIHKGKQYDMSYTLLTLVDRYLSQPKFQTSCKEILKSFGFLGDNRGSVILAGGVLLHTARPIYEIFEEAGKRVEMAQDEKGTPDSPRLSVLRGLQKYHVSKGGKS